MFRTLFKRKCGNSDFLARRDDVKCENNLAYKNLKKKKKKPFRNVGCSPADNIRGALTSAWTSVRPPPAGRKRGTWETTAKRSPRPKWSFARRTRRTSAPAFVAMRTRSSPSAAWAHRRNWFRSYRLNWWRPADVNIHGNGNQFSAGRRLNAQAETHLAEPAEGGHHWQHNAEHNANVDIVAGFRHPLHSFDNGRGNVQHRHFGFFGLTSIPNGAADWKIGNRIEINQSWNGHLLKAQTAPKNV